MNTRLTLIFAVAFACVIHTTAQNSPSAIKPSTPVVSFDEKSILEVEGKRVSAMLTGDLKTLENLWTEDFIQVTSYGEIRKKAHMVNAFKTGDIKYSQITNSDIMIINYGHTAIVTGRAVRKGKERTRDLTGYFRFTRTWIKQDGQWRLASQHSTVTEKF